MSEGPSTVAVVLLLFARVREVLGEGKVPLTVAVRADRASIREAIVHQYPSLDSLLGDCVFAVNEEYLEDGLVSLSTGDEIAVIPPISGG